MDKKYIELVKLERSSESFSPEERKEFYSYFGQISDHLRRTMGTKRGI